MIADSSRYTLKDKGFPLEIIHIQHERLTPRHSHDFFEFVYVERGFSLHRAQGSTALILPGDLLAVPPGVEHEYWKSINNSVYNCIFYPAALGANFAALKELPLLSGVFDDGHAAQIYRMHLNALQRQQAVGCLSQIDSELDGKGIGWPLRAGLLLSDFLIGMSRAYDGSHCDNIPKRDSDNLGLIDRIIASVDELDANAADEPGVETLAHRAGCSPEHYSRSFKKLTGMPPSAFILSAKIARAAENLLRPDISIGRAAEAAGFEDVNYFARVFKKETGLTPTEFRRQNFSQNEQQLF